MTNEYQNGGGFENHLLRKLPCKMAQSHDCIWKALWNHNLEHFRGEGEKRRKMNLSWWTKIGFKKGVDFWLEMKVLNLKESEQMMMMIICFCSIMSVCQFVKSNEHLFYYNCFHVYVNFQPLCFHHAVPLETIEKYQMTTLSFIQQPFVWTFICICCNVTLHGTKVEQNRKLDDDLVVVYFL